MSAFQENYDGIDWSKGPTFNPRPEQGKGESRRKGNIWRKGWRGRTLGVHPHQAKKFTAEAQAAGITGVSYCPQTGDMIATNREDRAAAAALRGFHDGDGGHVETKMANIFGLG